MWVTAVLWCAVSVHELWIIRSSPVAVITIEDIHLVNVKPSTVLKKYLQALHKKWRWHDHKKQSHTFTVFFGHCSSTHYTFACTQLYIQCVTNMCTSSLWEGIIYNMLCSYHLLDPTVTKRWSSRTPKLVLSASCYLDKYSSFKHTTALQLIPLHHRVSVG